MPAPSHGMTKELGEHIARILAMSLTGEHLTNEVETPMSGSVYPYI
jgi:hypothetical protein